MKMLEGIQVVFYEHEDDLNWKFRRQLDPFLLETTSVGRKNK